MKQVCSGLRLYGAHACILVASARVRRKALRVSPFLETQTTGKKGILMQLREKRLLSSCHESCMSHVKKEVTVIEEANTL
jgi:hypothetical protein